MKDRKFDLTQPSILNRIPSVNTHFFCKISKNLFPSRNENNLKCGLGHPISGCVTGMERIG